MSHPLKGVLAACAALAALLCGCDVDPYCVTCGDGGGVDGSRDGAVPDGEAVDGEVDASVGLDAAVMDGAPPGDGPIEECGEPEICNGVDDDCDGRVDEGFDLERDPFNCGACGVVCHPPHAFASCVAGECGIDSCDVGFLDLDGDSTNGCEYGCVPSAPDDVTCDLRDDDCDGAVDEDVDLMTDALNCGSCGNICRVGHGMASCVGGVCGIVACDPGRIDLDGDPTNGCEYACTAAVPPAEVCNGRDDDCNGVVDDGDPGGGTPCGSDAGTCSTGLLHCTAGALLCTGDVGPAAELCDGLDNDCDGVVDNGDPGGGAACGSGVGACRRGLEHCVGAALVCQGGTGPSPEVCNGVDDDCDGSIDDGDPGGGASCGASVGACAAGTLTCTGGVLVCAGAVGPTAEVCNGLDDDCNGSVDEGNPGGGAACGSNLGLCRPGVMTCSAGALSCVGETGPSLEVCNGLDDDCDGSIDEGNPGGGAACGSTVGACSAGALSCRGGTLVCIGATGPVAEVCNGLDDDCDGVVDQPFDLTRDASNCGMCGNVCSFANAFAACVGGTCSLAACASGFVDRDGLASNGCEYACDYRGTEVCNGFDDDCDGSVDNGLTPPATFCNPNGVCAGTVATCGAAAGWQCVYTSPDYQATETRCDSLDNDCDGAVDEPFPLKGTACTNGEQGACLRTGAYGCNAAGTGVVCSAPPSGGAVPEVCNGLDDDCDGVVDDGMVPGVIPTVPVPRAGGGTVDVMRYEASRPDATAAAAGLDVSRACSNSDVVPWTGVNHTEAQNACCALNASGTCLGGGAGWRLCDAADWQTACEGPSASCTYGYAATCSSSQPTTCNGHEYDCDTAAAGVQDCLETTGSPLFPACRADWGAPGSIHDLSGNVKEWTATPRGSLVYEIRGGSYTSIEPGRTCTFDFTAAEQTFAFGDTGFRCCHY